MKRFMSLFLVIAVLLSGMFILSSCNNNDTGNPQENSPDDNKITDKLICGVTIYEPMNYKDSAGNWTGFDTEFAILVGDRLGMEVEFQLIEWGSKFAELNSGAITAIWNGFTATANEPDGTPRVTLCDMSYSYMQNTQCLIVRSSATSQFTSIDDLSGKTIAAESGSAGESEAANYVGASGTVIGVSAQINCFMEVKSGASDGAIIDVILANQLAGTGDYIDIQIAFELEAEEYAIGFKTGNPLCDAVNAVMQELYDDGTLYQLAQKYNIEDRLYLGK